MLFIYDALRAEPGAKYLKLVRVERRHADLLEPI
jgi:hypothetical protein